MSFFTIFFIILTSLLVVNKYNICLASEEKVLINFDTYITSKNNLFLKKFNCDKSIYYVNIKNDDTLFNFYPKLLNNTNCVYTTYNYKYKPFLDSSNNDDICNTFKIQFQNDSINLLHMFYDKYPKDFVNNQVLYFSQFGVQRLLSENIIILGMATKHICSNQHVIGYNTLLHIPIFSQMQHPYSMNMGGEFWYKNLIFSLNGYYNLNKIMNFNKSLHTIVLIHPQIGYQIQLQIKLPYILTCKSQIKWEQFFYNKKDGGVFLNKYNENKRKMSIGIQYQPVPILRFDIDNFFMHNKYINTLLKISLNYQFNTPLSSQMKQKISSNENLSFINDLNFVKEPFIPKSDDTLINPSFRASEIFGYPGEIKFIEVDHDRSSFQCNKLLPNIRGSKILHLKDNSYVVYLPKHVISQENQTHVSGEMSDNMDEINRKKYYIYIIKRF